MAAEVPFRQQFCRAIGCGLMFFICRPCYRGQAYCSDECRRKSRREQLREANQRYQQDPEVRQDQCERMREYRRRVRDSRVIDQSSLIAYGSGSIGAPLVESDPPAAEEPHDLPKASWRERFMGVVCNICGRVGRFVAALIRRE
jgi:hypothetical protein